MVHVFSMHTDPFAQPGSGDAGGMNVYIARSVEAMLAADPALRIEVFTLDFGDGAAERSAAPEHPRCRVHYVPVSGTRGAAKNDLPKFTGGFVQAAVEAAQWVPQLIHAHYWLSGVAALNAAAHYATATAGSRTNVPVLFTPHTTAAAKDAHRGANEPAEPGYRRAEEGRIIAEANLIIANTPVEADQLQGYYGADPSRLRVITPGVDTSIFCPVAGVHAENEGSDTRSRIVFAGRPQPLKGPHLLVEALGLLPDDLLVELDIIGRSDSDYEQLLLQRAAQLQVADRVHLRHPVPASELAQIFRRADIVASPSSSESFGLVALEAQAAGAAVLASDVDGLRYAVENHVSGLLVAPRTPQHWAAAIERVVRAPRLRLTLGAQAAARARSFSWEQLKRVMPGAKPEWDHRDVTASIYAHSRDMDPVARMQHLDLFTWMRGDILVKADKMTMANSLELRVPFLDREVFAVAETIPHGLKITEGTTKYALRRAMEQIVPAHVLNRRKLGFPVPMRHWLAGDELYGWAQDTINASQTEDYFDKQALLQMLKEHRDGVSDHSRRLWTVLAFMVWHGIFVEKRIVPNIEERDYPVEL